MLIRLISTKINKLYWPLTHTNILTVQSRQRDFVKFPPAGITGWCVEHSCVSMLVLACSSCSRCNFASGRLKSVRNLWRGEVCDEDVAVHVENRGGRFGGLYELSGDVGNRCCHGNTEQQTAHGCGVRCLDLKYNCWNFYPSGSECLGKRSKVTVSEWHMTGCV